MDKQKQIEEMAKVIEEAMAKARRTLGGHNNIAMFYATMLSNADYRKIPENAVVLTDKIDIQQFEWSKLVDKMGIFKLIEKECAKIRKETAEKFAERLKALYPLDNIMTYNNNVHIHKTIDEICKEFAEVSNGK